MKVIIKEETNLDNTEFQGTEYKLNEEIIISNLVYNKLYSAVIEVDGLNARQYDIEVIDMNDVPATQVQPENINKEEKIFVDKIIGEIEAYEVILDQLIIKAEAKNGEKVDIECLIDATTAIYKVASRH